MQADLQIKKRDLSWLENYIPDIIDFLEIPIIEYIMKNSDAYIAGGFLLRAIESGGVMKLLEKSFKNKDRYNFRNNADMLEFIFGGKGDIDFFFKDRDKMENFLRSLKLWKGQRVLKHKTSGFDRTPAEFFVGLQKNNKKKFWSLFGSIEPVVQIGRAHV